MAPLILVLITFALFIGFFALTKYETSHGVRFFADERTTLDKRAAHIEFILEHVDLAAFARDEVRRLAARMSHDAAHLSLQAVRAAERLLTRLVIHLRTRRAVVTPPRENVREFVKTLADFKGSLNAVHPEVKGEE